MLEPLYTPMSCHAAFQLRWSLALFPIVDLPPADAWLTSLTSAVEPDGVRILECHSPSPRVWLFLLSTLPHAAPPQIVRSVKGRLQHVIRERLPRAFRRHFRLSSVGDVARPTVEAYFASQLDHHRMVDDRVQLRLTAYQLEFPEVDLARPVRSAHAEYIYNLHLVLVHDSRLIAVDAGHLTTSRDAIARVSRSKGHRISRLSLFSDHLHATIGCPFEQAPQQIALAYMNNVSYAHGMTHLFSDSYYVGTFGEYDMGAVRMGR